jgi:hypothetical protein
MNKLKRLLISLRLLIIHRKSGLFDPQWYLEANPDVKAARKNPWLHFALHGVFEGRLPNPFFNSRNYLALNQDVTFSKLNAVSHYMLFGFREGRLNQVGGFSVEQNSRIQKQKRIFNDGIHEPIHAIRDLQNFTSSTALREFGYSYLSPLLSHYLRFVVSNLNNNYIPICLAREGYLFKNAIKCLKDELFVESSVQPLYLKVSRTLLFKSLVGSDSNCPELFESNFSGTFATFLSGRCGMTASFVKCQLSSQDANKCISLPRDTEIAQRLINKYKKQIIKETSNTKAVLLNYFKSLGLFDNPETPMFLDLGYSGTIQKLLTRLLDRDTHGIYVISSCPGSFPVGDKFAVMKGTLKENVKLGDGYIPLERSLFWECLLTSPHGQMLDILEIGKEKFEFLYGPSAGAQRFAHSLNELHQGAIQGILENFRHGIDWSIDEIEHLSNVQTSNAWSIPRLIQHLFTVDDSTSGHALINPLRIHHMAL